MTNPFPHPAGKSIPEVFAGPSGARQREWPSLDDVELKGLSLCQLRGAIRANRVTFPSPVPTFERHDRPDLQWRIAQLYFVSGWSSDTIAGRFSILRQRVCQILNTWKRRAMEMGYIQCIPAADAIKPPKGIIHVVISPARECRPTALQPDEIREGAANERTCVSGRPRRKANLPQIIERLASARGAADLAVEAGVARATVHGWKSKYGALADEAHELRKLRAEIEELKKTIADMSTSKEPLIHPIRKTYRFQA